MNQAGTGKEPGVTLPAPDQQGPRNRLCRAAGAVAPSGGSAAHEVASVGAIFQWPIRVYWEDTDAGGIVFYANYLKFFERSRTEWLRSLGIAQQRLKDETGGLFVVTQTSIRYLRPARLDDELIVTASLIETGRASLIIKQQALLKTEQTTQTPNPGQADRLLCEGSIRIGWVDAANLKPTRMPASLYARFPS
ncbi:MAG: tol-pal system-associated acyl-CoA thioesterase [Polaromonas sp.]|nr:tol-pal system-associated acyl-CoA thioesterase [Polaromonas sp.]